MTTIIAATVRAVRLATVSRARLATVALPVGAATAAGVLLIGDSASDDDGWALALGAVAMAVLVIAHRSPRPEREASRRAWSQAGGGRAQLWALTAVETVFLGWACVVASATIGFGALLLGGTGDFAAAGGFVAALLGGVALIAACVPGGVATTTRDARRTIATVRGRMVTGVRLTARVAVVLGSVVVCYRLATSVRTDFDVLLVGMFTVVLLTVATTMLSAPAIRAVVSVLEHLPSLRRVVPITAGQRTPTVVRLVIAAAATVVAVTTIFGASIEARPEVYRQVDNRLRRLPSLPPGVALVRLAPFASGSPVELSPELRDAIERSVPDAELIELAHVTNAGSTDPCPYFGCLQIREEPRLQQIYGSSPRYDLESVVFPTIGRTRVPTRHALARDLEAGRPLPQASFEGAIYSEVPAGLLEAGRQPTAIQSVFVKSPQPLTDAQLSSLAETVQAAPNDAGRLTLIGPDGPIVGEVSGRGRAATLRNVPWATTAGTSRWATALVAGALAIFVLLAAVAIDSIDRRHDQRRLEAIGATTGQVRAAAALYAGTALAVATWFTTGIVISLLYVGTAAFNRSQPEIAVPVELPWPLLVFVTLGLPTVAAALAALLARLPAADTRPSS